MLASKFSLALAGGALLLASLAAEEPGKTAKKGGKDVRAAYERLTKLVGEWQLKEVKDDALKGKTAVRYRLTAGKNALVETLFPGDDKEMVTIYHRDGDELVLTHYCCCGNQPRMRANIGHDKDELVFEFAGGSNLNPEKDLHMHNYRVRFVDADHIKGEWEYYQDGKAAGKHTFDLVRKK
jgi:hypothetical protein